MKCKKSKDCEFYDEDSYNCNYDDEGEYCGHYRKSILNEDSYENDE